MIGRRLNNTKISEAVKRQQEYGKLNLKIGQLPSMKPQKINDVFEDTYEFVISNSRPVRTKKNKKGTKRVCNRNIFDIATFKEEALDYAGLGSSKLNDKSFRGDKKLTYDPFSQNIGSVANFSGHNAGGDSDFKNTKAPMEAAASKAQIIGGRKGKIIAKPNPYPEVLYPDQQIKYKSMKIKC